MADSTSTVNTNDDYVKSLAELAQEMQDTMETQICHNMVDLKASIVRNITRFTTLLVDEVHLTPILPDKNSAGRIQSQFDIITNIVKTKYDLLMDYTTTKVDERLSYLHEQKILLKERYPFFPDELYKNILENVKATRSKVVDVMETNYEMFVTTMEEKRTKALDLLQKKILLG